MKVSLEFPDTASLTQFDHDYLKTVLVATLYHPRETLRTRSLCGVRDYSPRL